MLYSVSVPQVSFEVVSLSFHPFGMALAAGSTEGHLIVLNAETSATVASVRVCGSPLSCLAYNPGLRPPIHKGEETASKCGVEISKIHTK